MRTSGAGLEPVGAGEIKGTGAAAGTSFAFGAVRCTGQPRRAPADEVTIAGQLLHTPVLVLPIANCDDNQHGADENLRLQNLRDGLAVYVGVFAGMK